MSNTFQTNSFVSGMNLDVDITAIPQDEYRYAENVRIMTDKDGTSGVLQNIKSAKLIPGGDFLSEDEIVLATSTINQYGVIFTVDSKDINRVYRIWDYDTSELQHILVVKGALGYSKTSRIRIVSNYESDTIIKIYFVDGESSIRTLNIMSDRYVPGKDHDDTLDEEGNIKNPNSLNINPSTLLVAPVITTLNTNGQLTSGVVQYAYQLFNERGTSTGYSPVSNLMHLTTSNTNNNYFYEGVGKDVNTGKSAIIDIDVSNVISGLFDKCRIVRIKYTDNSQQPTIDVIDEVDLPQSSTSMNYQDFGTKILNTLTVEEFNSYKSSNFTAGTIEKKDNILFAADIKEATWKPDYDARAYRFTENNKLILQSSDTNQNISVVTNNSNIDSVFEDLSLNKKRHDCINPYNLRDYNFAEQDACKYQFNDGSNPKVLGGTGPNISYKFIYAKISLGSFSSKNVNIGQTTDNYISQGIYDVNSNQQIGTVKYPVREIRYDNYSDPYFSSKFKSYQRDEIYRFGIVFYNDSNIATPVYWIADIKFPHSREACPWYMNDSFPEGKPIGIEFTVKNIPAGTKAYEIVRCKRTYDDRTVLMQGILSDTTSFPWRMSTVGDWLRNENDIRPKIPLGVSDANYNVARLGPGPGIEDWISFEYKRVQRDLFSLMTPEIDYSGDSVLNGLDACYIDLSHWLESRFDQAYFNGVRYEKYFASPDYTYLSDTSTKEKQQNTEGAIYTPQNCFLIGENFSHNDDEALVNNIIGKHYHSFYSSIYPNRVSIEIDKAVATPEMYKDALNSSGAYYRTIDNRQYINAAVCWNNESDMMEGWPSAKRAYFGRNAALKLKNSNFPRHQNVDINTVQSSEHWKDRFRVVSHTPFSVPVVNIKKNTVPYGGNGYNNRSNSTYISTSSYTVVREEKSSSAYVFGGDTYLCVWDHRTAAPIPMHYGDDYGSRNSKVSISDYILIETTINLNLTYGSSTSRSDDMTFSNPYLSVNDAGGGSLGYANQPKNYYMYNDAYSIQPDAKLYVVDSTSSISNLREPYKIIYSDTKTANEISDSWSQFRPANYMMVDSQYGPVTNMRLFGGRLFFWQDQALGIASVNDRSLIQDNNVGSLVLGIGGVLTRYDYVTTNNGSSISNDNSIVSSDASLYWYDTDKNEICSYSDSVHKLSKEKYVQSFLNSNPNIKVHTAFYDNSFNEIQLCFDSSVLVFNEYTQRFTSFYTFNPESHIKFSDKLIYIQNNKLMETKDFPLNTMQSRIQLVVNKDPLQTKTFDNVFFSGKFTNIKDMLINASFRTKNQNATILEDYIEGGYTIDYREDTYRFAIGRETTNDDTTSYPGRLRGKYLICDYTFNCNDQHNFNLPNINTTYRYSLV